MGIWLLRAMTQYKVVEVVYGASTIHFLLKWNWVVLLLKSDLLSFPCVTYFWFWENDGWMWNVETCSLSASFCGG